MKKSSPMVMKQLNNFMIKNKIKIDKMILPLYGYSDNKKPNGESMCKIMIKNDRFLKHVIINGSDYDINQLNTFIQKY